MTKLQQKKLPLFLCFLCLISAGFIQNHRPSYLNNLLGLINGIQYDTVIKYDQHEPPQRVRVVVVNIDNRSIEKEGRWPWPRNKLALLENNLKKAGVVVVAYDIVMAQAEVNYALGLKKALTRLPSEDKALAQQMGLLLDKVAKFVDNNQSFADAIKQSEVVLGYLFDQESSLKIGMLPSPLVNEKQVSIDASQLATYHFTGYEGSLKELLEAAPHSGFVSAIYDSDDVLRHDLLVAAYHHKLYASLALSTVMRYLMANGIELKTYANAGVQKIKGIYVGGVFIPTNPKGQVLIPYYGPPGTMEYYSASDVIEGHLSANQLAGAIAVVGSTMLVMSDLHPSPLYDEFPGVEVNANVISGILSQQMVAEYDWQTRRGAFILVLLGLFPAILFAFLGPILLPIAYVFLIFALWLSSLLLFIHQKIYIDWSLFFLLLTTQATVNFVCSFYDERRQKNRIRHLFGQYVPPSHIKQLTASPKTYNMDGESRNMTVFFADIRDFTSISASLDAIGVKHLLNTIFTPITDIIFKHQGTIDKYVGDMIVAFWGAPLEDSQHPRHAVEAALAIKQHLPIINQQLQEINLPSVKLGMGLCTGLMNVGDMGSTFRRAYTVLGDTVNLASRLQSLTKFYQVNILTNEATRSNQEDLIWQLIDKVVVKGSKEVVTIYEPLGYRKEITPALSTELQEYESALYAYYQQDWEAARDRFEALCASYPKRYLYKMYAVRIAEKRNEPKLPDWDGAFIHTHK